METRNKAIWSKVSSKRLKKLNCRMPINISLAAGKKVYFASDFHLGAPTPTESLVREKRIIAWLDEIKADAQIICLVGDLFDFWFEYKRTVPKGYVRFLGKLAELTDSGIELHIYTGNHDLWMNDFFQKELGAKVLFEPQKYVFNNQTFLVGHGDGLGPGDYGYKFLKKVFTNSICRFLFGRVLHPNLSLLLGYTWSLSSWKKNRSEDTINIEADPNKELLYLYAKEQEASQNHHDCYIFGHRHLKWDLKVNQDSRYINLGDWIRFNSYAVFDGKMLDLLDWHK